MHGETEQAQAQKIRAEQQREVAEEAREFEQRNKNKQIAAQRAQVCTCACARCSEISRRWLQKTRCFHLLSLLRHTL